MTHLLVDLNEADLLARMRNFEDHFTERKTIKDEKDWKKTAVAFANSAPMGLPAVLFIGVTNKGEIEVPQKDLDECQKKFNSQMTRVYPRIAYVSKIVNDGGRQALAVIVPGSELRPHFAGLSYIRVGSESPEASERQYNEMIAQRNNKSALLLKWKGQRVTVVSHTRDSEIPWPNTTTLVDCNQFYVTLQKVIHEPEDSFPLSRVEPSFDNFQNTLRLELSEPYRAASLIKGTVSGLRATNSITTGLSGKRWHKSFIVEFSVYLCNHSSRETNLQRLEFDGSSLTPPVTFGPVSIMHHILSDGKGITFASTVAASIDWNDQRPLNILTIDLAKLKVEAVDGFLDRHLLEVETGEILTQK